MKCYVINLDRSGERLTHMRTIFANLEVNFERVSAVDGRTMSAVDLEQLVEAQPSGHRLTPTEVGCFLSHRKCFELIANGSEQYACVFEDDAVLSSSIGNWLRTSDWIPSDADIIKLETDGSRVLIGRSVNRFTDGRNLARLMSRHVCTAGYIISKSCAQHLLSKTITATVPIDELIFNPDCGVFHSLVIYQFSPALCKQAGIQSTIDRQNRTKTQIHLFAKILREIVRPFRQLFDALNSRFRGQLLEKIPFA